MKKKKILFPVALIKITMYFSTSILTTTITNKMSIMRLKTMKKKNVEVISVRIINTRMMIKKKKRKISDKIEKKRGNAIAI